MKISEIASKYFDSLYYSRLSLNSKIAYESAWKIIKVNKIDSINFCDWEAENIFPVIVENLKEDIYYKRGPSAARITFALLNNVWKRAIRLGLIKDYNPWRQPEIPLSKRREKLWTDQQVIRFVHLCRNEFKWNEIVLAFLLCYETGQRPIDILAIRLSDIEDNKISFRQKKTKNPVSFIVPEYMIASLKQQINKAQLSNINTWLFPDYTRNSHMSYDYFFRKFDHIKKQDNIFNGLQIRDLRRTAITEAHNSGATDWEVQNLGGHKNPQSTIPYRVLNNEASYNAQKSRWANRKESYRKELEEQSQPEN